MHADAGSPPTTEAGPICPEFRPETTFGYRLWHVSHAWQRHSEAALAAFDLTHLQFVLLANTALLAREGVEPTQTAIARQTGVDRMMVSKVLQLLDAKGFIERLRHPDDERAKRVALTAAGGVTLRGAIPAMLAAQDSFFGRLTEHGRTALRRELDRLLVLENILPPPRPSRRAASGEPASGTPASGTPEQPEPASRA